MLTFKNITVRNAAMLRRYYENCDYALCEYSALSGDTTCHAQVFSLNGLPMR